MSEYKNSEDCQRVLHMSLFSPRLTRIRRLRLGGKGCCRSPCRNPIDSPPADMHFETREPKFSQKFREIDQQRRTWPRENKLQLRSKMRKVMGA